MNILVTGGAGFIGSNLTEELVNKGHNVTVLDNLHTGSIQNLDKVIDSINIIEEPCNYINKLNLPDEEIIFHLGIPSSSPMYKQNPHLVGDAINDTIDIFEYARKNNNIKKVIFASSSSLYNGIRPPHREDMNIRVTDYYTEARFAIERIAKLYNVLYGIKSAGLRFFSVYGPHEENKGIYANIISQFLWGMKRGKSATIYGNGKQERDFTYVKDIVKACTLMLDEDFEYEIYNVGTGTSYSFNDVVDILNNTLDTDIRPTYIEMPMKNYVDKTLADIRKIRHLGYKPDYSLTEGIYQLAEMKNMNQRRNNMNQRRNNMNQRRNNMKSDNEDIVKGTIIKDYVKYIQYLEKNNWIRESVTIYENLSSIVTINSLKANNEGTVLNIVCPPGIMLYFIGIKSFSEDFDIERIPYLEIKLANSNGEEINPDIKIKILKKKILNKDEELCELEYKDIGMLNYSDSPNLFKYHRQLFRFDKSIELKGEDRLKLYVVNPDKDIDTVKFNLGADIWTLTY